MTEHVIDRLYQSMARVKTPLCIGLDPDLSKFPQSILDRVSRIDDGGSHRAAATAIRIFNYAIIDATCDIVGIYKPQSAYYEKHGHWGVEALEDTADYAREKGAIVILDAKRNDIGRTSEAYANAHLGKVLAPNGQYIQSADNVDFITVTAYLGSDGVKPFVDVADKFDKGIFVLAKTSNPSSGDLQNLKLESGIEVYVKMAELINEWGKGNIGECGYSNIGAVVGATMPKEAAKLRTLLSYAVFLMPGFGTQGAKAEMLTNGFDKNGRGAIVSSSSGITYAFSNDKFAKRHPQLAQPEKFAQAARQETLDNIVDITAALKNANKLPRQWAA